MAQFARSHNDANILIIATKYTDYEEVEKITETFLTNKFEGGRHSRRINQIKEYDRND
jgi:ribose 5-phosphate isomerase B